ncbi:glycosyltransferase family protein [Mangrovibacterium marinum]|uniref:Uncharacterized protein (TIGR00661 family) n=1 Tax=Mangrovibacterium marinum TaxID=1639118 RepID=A0A2T5BYS4_9BACT|nr:glycosyltransferase family protein [Mangrovibacterium marinum]PTN07386.1 uncharacterized protein (TIGR00661 family) [Mangrovibacterium marinum]
MNHQQIKILYAIQGTGNGHLARATEIIPLLNKLGQTDLLVSGTQGDLALPFRVKYKRYGLSFIFGKHGGVSIGQTIRQSRPFRLLRDILSLPVDNYDLVISDFEPVSAWACKLRGKACIGLSHQNAVLHPHAPAPPQADRIGRFILKHYAPATIRYGFHFKPLDAQNFAPVIRSSIRQAKPRQLGHYTVYLPAYSNAEIAHILRLFPQYNWQVFSKHCREDYRQGSIWFRPVSLEAFTNSFVNCTGILCTAGFETPAEAIYMGKKLCVIPMKNQYEQACNAEFLRSMGIRVLSDWHHAADMIDQWLRSNKPLHINYPDETFTILRQLVRQTVEHHPERTRSSLLLAN